MDMDFSGAVNLSPRFDSMPQTQARANQPAPSARPDAPIAAPADLFQSQQPVTAAITQADAAQASLSATTGQRVNLIA